MKIIQLYRIIESTGATTISPREPESGEYYLDRFRVIADENKVLRRNGAIYGPMTDTDTNEGWEEIDQPKQ